jgi:hypothetical protein
MGIISEPDPFLVLSNNTEVLFVNIFLFSLKIDKTDRVDWWCTIELEARTGESTSPSPTCVSEKRNKASLANTARAARRASCCCCDAPDVHRRPRGRHGERDRGRGRGASHRMHVCRPRPLARLPFYFIPYMYAAFLVASIPYARVTFSLGGRPTQL